MSQSEDLMGHMRSVLSAERDLRDLALVWQMIESTAAIACPEEAEQILQPLTETRRRFDELQRRLIEQMVVENRSELGDDLNANAQCAIDILVRNLFERTADVGFLATDDVVREFCATTTSPGGDNRAPLLRRLGEYQAKYTVYDDIVLLAADGRVLARLDDSMPIEVVSEPFVAEALARQGYVEFFGATALASDGRPALLYAHRIDTADGRMVGVLALRFRFVDEMKRIFAAVVDDPHRAVLMLVDQNHAVISSSDAAHVPIGTRLPALASAGVELASFAGREYIACCCVSGGYQGYGGPPWRAVAMVSLLTAFRHRAGTDEADVPLDNAALKSVQTESEDINRELRRVLWNGSVLIAGEGSTRTQLKAVLRQVSMTGRRTRTRVTQAIHDIYRVALSRGRHQARDLARLAANVMDRNLYERANDCRWWALSPVLRRQLAMPSSEPGNHAMHEVLSYINGLYTVYSQLVVFDAQGVIRAVSVDDGAERFTGGTVPDTWRLPIRALTTSQNYAVTAFEDTPLHDHGDTYVYLAAIRSDVGGQIVGGIGIVFNSARELGAILTDILGERNGFAAFVESSGKIIASTDATMMTGPALAVRDEAQLIEHRGAHYACSRQAAPGYREFKLSDGYDNGVHVIVGLRLGAFERRKLNFGDLEFVAPQPSSRGDSVEMAIFQVGALLYALPATVVAEAIARHNLVRTPSIGGATLGMVEVGSRLVRVVCARQLFGVTHEARKTDGVVLVLRPGGPDSTLSIGLRVDEVLSVIEASPAMVHPAPPGLKTFSPWVSALIDCQTLGPEGASTTLVQLLSHECMLEDLARDISFMPDVEAREATARSA